MTHRNICLANFVHARNNNGHVSRQQFKQTLSMLNYYFGPDELDAMSVLYCDSMGFNYLKLLDDIDPKNNESGWVLKDYIFMQNLFDHRISVLKLAFF